MVSSVYHQNQGSSSSVFMPTAATLSSKKMPSYAATVSPTHRRGDGSFMDSISYTGYNTKRPRPLMLSQNVDYSKVLQVETSVEYDLPAHIYPPKNAEPILMVDRDYMNRKSRKSSRKSTTVSSLSSGVGVGIMAVPAGVSTSLNFLSDGGSGPGIGTSSVTSSAMYTGSDRLRHNSTHGSHNNNGVVQSSRSRKSAGGTSSSSSSSSSSSAAAAACSCQDCLISVCSAPYTKAVSYTAQTSKPSKVVTTVNLTDSPHQPHHQPPPAYQARPTPRSTKKSKALSQQQQIQQTLQQQQQLQLQLHQQQQQQQQQKSHAYQQQQSLVYPVPPPSYATATSTYGSYHHKSIGSSLCPSLCECCTTPMVGAGPPDLVPHGFSTAHVVRSRGSPKLRSRRHLAASTASNLPEYRRARANTISHTSSTASQHHHSLPISLLASENNATSSGHSRLQDPVVSQSLVLKQVDQSQQESAREAKMASKRRGAPHQQNSQHLYHYDIYEARIADTAQMYSAPITPAELMDEDLFVRGVSEMDTSSGHHHTNNNNNNTSSGHHHTNTNNNNTSSGHHHTNNNNNNNNDVFNLGSETSVASRIYAHEKAMEAKTNSLSISINNSLSSSRLARKSNSSSSRSSTSASVNSLSNSSTSSNSNSNASSSSHQYHQQQRSQQQQQQQQQSQFLSHLFRQQEYLKTSSPSTQPSSTLSTPSRISGLGGHHDFNQDSTSLGGSSSNHFGSSSNFGSVAPLNYRDFLLENVMMASSPQPSATALFSSPIASHLASQMLAVPTPPQSNSVPTPPQSNTMPTPPQSNTMPTVPPLSANRFLATMYQLNAAPPYNLVY